MRWYVPVILIYSALICVLEFNYGQDYARHYLTDAKGPVLFYGIHTIITTVLLCIISYNFILCYFFAQKTKRDGLEFKWFFISQSLVFLYLAIDDRFMLHERIAYVLGISDAIPLLVLAIIEAVLLVYYKQISLGAIKWNSAIILGSICFSIMIIIDTFAPLNGILRLSFEDLFKLWGIFFLFRFSCITYLKWLGPYNKIDRTF